MRTRSKIAAAAAVAATLVLTAMLPASADPADGGDPGTTTPATIPTETTETTVPPSSTETTLATEPPATVPAETTTSTIVPGPPEIPSPPLPPDLVSDPRAPLLVNPGDDDSGDLPIGQPLFSSVNNQVLADKVAAVSAELVAAQKAAGDLQFRILAQQVTVGDLQAKVDAAGSTIQENVAAAAKAKAELREHAVNAYITGSRDQKMAIVAVEDPIEAGVARRYLESVVSSDNEAVDAYNEAKAKLTGAQEALAADLGSATTDLNNLIGLSSAVAYNVIAKTQELEAYKAGAQVYVAGFVFPVTGSVEFIDSWGFPRMTGTASAHWHQGTDIMAPMGTPLVATESGYLEKIGEAGLGGQRLWVVGDTGTKYYYAHLSAYAPGIHEGMRVTAGDVVGFVGNTGNAAGGPTHLHFEVHPGGGAAVNPYPLLKAAYGSKPMVKVEVDPVALAAATAKAAAAAGVPVPPPVDPAAAAAAAPAPAPAPPPG